MKAVYPGTFDPITNGHLDVIKRASKIFSHITIGVARNAEKSPMFTEEKRKQIIEEVLLGAKIKNVEVKIFTGLLVDFASELKAGVIIRGLRAVSDFEYEFQMACVNNRLNSSLETVFLPASEDMHFISSRFIKSIATLKGDVSQFVPKEVLKHFK